MGFPDSSTGKEPACNAGDPGLIPGWGRSPGEGICYPPVFLGFPGSSDGKESTCNAGDLGLIPGLGRSPGGWHGNLLQYCFLENPHGQRSLASYSPLGCKEWETNELLSMQVPFKDVCTNESVYSNESDHEWSLLYKFLPVCRLHHLVSFGWCLVFQSCVHAVLSDS